MKKTSPNYPIKVLDKTFDLLFSKIINIAVLSKVI